jgi:hypothetical protein
VNGSNGNGARKYVDDTWEVVAVGTSAFIGSVRRELDGTDGGYVTMCPCLQYVSNPNITPAASGRGFDVQGATRFALPFEMMASEPAQRIRWDRRYRIADFDESDRAQFESIVAQAYEMARAARAARSGLTLLPGLPKNMPPPPGVRS